MFGNSTRSLILGVVGVSALYTFNLWAQSPTFAGNAQHTAQFAVPAQHLNHLRWSATIQNVSTFSHYGAPIVSVSNTVIFAQINGGTASIVSVKALEGAMGRLKYTLSTDFR